MREARNHELLCPHPHILNFVAAWEECGRLYIQTELCSTSLLLHAENQPPGPGLSEKGTIIQMLILAFVTHNMLCFLLQLNLKSWTVLTGLSFKTLQSR